MHILNAGTDALQLFFLHAGKSLRNNTVAPHQTSFDLAVVTARETLTLPYDQKQKRYSAEAAEMAGAGNVIGGKRRERACDY